MKKEKLILLTTMVMMSVYACGTTSANSTSTNASGTSATTQSSSEQQEISENQDVSGETEHVSKTEETTAAKEEALVFEAFSPIDNDECAVTVKEIDPDDTWGYCIKFGLENKSAEKTYMYSVTAASVNGVDSDPFFATEVAPGKKSNDELNFVSSDLEKYGITDFTDIEICFRVYDTDDWMADPVADEVFHIYPYGEEKATIFVREEQSTDVILADNDYVSVVLIGQEDDSIWGYTLKLFIQNKSDFELMVSVDEASVNGYMADPFFAKSILPGKCAFTEMSWDPSTLEENGISDIEEIEFKLKVYDEDNWVEDLLNEVITVTP